MSSDYFRMITEMDLPKPKGVLQVGASYGQELQEFLDFGIHAGILVEPLEAPFQYVKGISRNLPTFVIEQALCTDVKDKVYQFYVASNGGQSSSINKPLGHLEVFDFVKFDQTVDVVSTTVDHLMEKVLAAGHQDTVGKIDTMYLDVQGAEYLVFLGAIKTLKQINTIYFEVIRGNLYDSEISLSTYINFLDSQGFTLNNINFNKSHHANAFFIRKSLLKL